MSATNPSVPASATSTDTTSIRPASLRRTTVLVGLAAAAAVTAVAAAAHAAGASLEVQGEMIPLAGIAQMVFIGAVIGGLLLAALNRWSDDARRRFLQVTAVLTALSCVPSVALPDDVATKATLVALHLLAAAIIVPVLARLAHD
jgi:hypothetical protein